MNDLSKTGPVASFFNNDSDGSLTVVGAWTAENAEAASVAARAWADAEPDWEFVSIDKRERPYAHRPTWWEVTVTLRRQGRVVPLRHPFDEAADLIDERLKEDRGKARRGLFGFTEHDVAALREERDRLRHLSKLDREDLT